MGEDLLMAQISEQGHGIKPSKPGMQFNEFKIKLKKFTNVRILIARISQRKKHYFKIIKKKGGKFLQVRSKVQCSDPYMYQNSLNVYDLRQIRKIPLFSSLSA